MTRFKVKLAIFDLDGTLIDSIEGIRAAVNQLLDEHGQQPLTREAVTSMVGEGAARLIDRVLAARPGTGLDTTAALQRYLALYEADPLRLTRLYPCVAETLARLRAHGIRLALCTNKPERPSRAILAHFGLADGFDRIVGGDTLPWCKPDRRVLERLLDDLGMTADEAVLVGDSEVDAATAAAAGLPFILMTYGYRRTPVEAIACDAALDDFRDLVAQIVPTIEAGAKGTA
jgi:phosphoglycolate phosphatase